MYQCSTADSAHPISISIVTPCYNGARYLEETLKSAAAQSKAPLEIIVVDDGSTDASADIAEAFGPPVRVIRQPNQGESVARNRGLAEARGSHVLFLDADDLLAPLALEKLSEAIESRPKTVALMGCARFSADPNIAESVVPATFDSFFPDIVTTNLGPIHCYLTPREVLNAAGGFFGSLQWSEDWDLWWRVGLNASGLVSISYIGALYRQHPNSQYATTTLANRARGHAILLGRMVPAIVSRPALLEQFGMQLFWACWTAVKQAREHGVPWQELAALLEGMKTLAHEGPVQLRRSPLALALRLVGARTALAVQRS